MRVVFMGTASFAAKSLTALYDGGFEVVGVFTKPDTPKGRGMKLVPDEVKTIALSHGTDVFQPEKLRTGEALATLKSLSPDVIAVVSYGKILPPDILAVPEKGCINIHGSLLPKYRGAAPVQWAVLNGDKKTGVTSMYMAEGMDTGDIIMTRETEIGENETSGELYERLGLIGAELLCETLSAIESGKCERQPQNDEDATYAPMLSKEMSPIDWEKSVNEILSQIKGLNPWPAATACIAGVSLKIFAAEKDKSISGTPGELLFADKRGLGVAAKDGAVIITELQAANGKRMRAADYLRGHPICP